MGGARIRGGTVNGKPFMAQVERVRQNLVKPIRVAHNGTRLDALVPTHDAAAPQADAISKAPPEHDRATMLYALAACWSIWPIGQPKVQTGERVAVIKTA
jgi:propionyl-CoA carboxylase alpha chain